MSRLAIAGGGTWGTALAIVLAPRFSRVSLWMHEQDLAARMAGTRENDVFLPGFPLPANVAPGCDLAAALKGAELVLGVMPSQFARPLYARMADWMEPGAIVVSATKGLESGSLLRMSEVIADVLGKKAGGIGVLSGPTFAREIAGGQPAAVVIASADETVAKRVQSCFSGPTFRLYTNDDPIGVEIGAALKNVVAIGAGVCQGLGLGNNTLAALITRGLAEITRLAVAMGAKPKTMAGLAGLGDLVLTCTGDLSRNRQVGIELARGRAIEEIVGSMKMIAEGVKTTASAVALASRFGVEMPITLRMSEMLREGKSPRAAIRELMERSLKGE